MVARITDNDIDHLSWIWQRLVNHYGDKANADYMLKLYGIIIKLKQEYECGEVEDNNKPRTKPSYEKVEDAKAGDLLFVKNDDEYTECIVICWHPHRPEIVVETDEMIGTATLEDLYRKVEKPIEWWEDLVECIDNTTDGSGYAESIKGEKLHVTASMTRDQWCDFARILLEQGE